MSETHVGCIDGKMISVQRGKNAIDTGIHPGQHDKEAVEQILGGHGYSENTLSTYRTHLEQWFDRFGSRTNA